MKCILFDETLSPLTGAHNISTIHQIISMLESEVLKPTYFDETESYGKLAGIVYRLGKTALLDNVIDHYAYLIQHDYFGHGWRGRENGFRDISYRLALPLPYSDGHGKITWRAPDGKVLTSDEHVSTVIGGFDATSALAQLMRFNWMMRGRIHYREARLYLQSSTDLTTYTLFTKWGLRSSEGNDVTSFISSVNSRERITISPALTLGGLSNQLVINALDPFLFFSLWTLVKSYIWSGDEEFAFPTLCFSNVKYLPLARLGLTPFGTEMYVENFISTSSDVVNLYFRLSVGGSHEFWGGGIEGVPLFESSNVRLRANLAFWKQPPLALDLQPGSMHNASVNDVFGVSATVVTFYTLPFESPTIDLVSHIGYKTAGFVQGESLGEGVVLRLGVKF
ncbi:MAG: hypothetical protein HRF44_00225 [Ignavibacterium sp.]|jgi:hypothetical protein